MQKTFIKNKLKYQNINDIIKFGRANRHLKTSLLVYLIYLITIAVGFFPEESFAASMVEAVKAGSENLSKIVMTLVPPLLYCGGGVTLAGSFLMGGDLRGPIGMLGKCLVGAGVLMEGAKLYYLS